MPRPYGLMFEQGTTGRYNRLAGLGASSVDLTTLYPIPVNDTTMAYQGKLYSDANGVVVGTYGQQPTTIGSSLSSLWPWLAGGLVVGVLLFRR